MAFAILADAIYTTVVSYTLGSGSITVASVAGMPTPSALAPVLITTVRLASYAGEPETYCTYQATGITSETLTGLTVVDGVDTAWVAGDAVEMRICARHVNDHTDALQTSLLTVADEATLPGSRQLVPGSNITLTDGGAGSTLTIAAAGGGSPGGSSSEVQYNNSSVFGGAAHLSIGSAGQVNYGAISAPGSPSNGDTWYDSTQGAHAWFGNGLTGYRTGLIYAQTANVTVTATGSSSLISTSGAVGSVSLPAGYLNVVGRTLRISVRGYGSTASSGSGSVFFFFKLGSNCVATTSTLAMKASATTNQGEIIDCLITTKTTGAGGTVDCAGMVSTNYFGPFTQSLNHIQNGTTPGVLAATTSPALDLTAAYVLDVQINYSATGNLFTSTNVLVEVIG